MSFHLLNISEKNPLSYTAVTTTLTHITIISVLGKCEGLLAALPTFPVANLTHSSPSSQNHLFEIIIESDYIICPCLKFFQCLFLVFRIKTQRLSIVFMAPCDLAQPTYPALSCSYAPPLILLYSSNLNLLFIR